MLTSAEIVAFDNTEPPAGANAFIDGASPLPARMQTIAEPDPTWPEQFSQLATLIRSALGPTVLALEHVGSTSVPGLAAKPVIDIDLTVADSAEEASYVPALAELGFRHTIREPWWYEHRCLRREREPMSYLHVWSPDSPEAARHLIFRDWLTANAADRALYEQTKREAMAATQLADGHTMDYNAVKQMVIREIYGRAFVAAGLLAPPTGS